MHTQSSQPASAADRRRFRVGLAAVGLGALVLRIGWVLVARRNFALKGDDFYYHWQANALADGLGFVNPLTWKALDRLDPSAAHPPLYSMYLAVVSWFGGTSPLTHRIASCLLGAGGVVVVGLVARRIAGHRAGLLAAGVAAVYPMLWINDGMLVSESMYVPMVALILLAAYRLWDSRSLLDAAFLGGAIGLGALTRPEAIMLVPFMGIAFLLARGWELRRRVTVVLAVGAACLIVILPWWARNLTTFQEPVFLATGHGSVLQVSNCDSTYDGEFLGYWDIRCLTDVRPPENEEQQALLESTEFPGIAYLLLQDPRDESIPDVRARDRAFEYIGDHARRAPIVAAARVGRVLGFYRVGQGIDLDVFFERRGLWPSRLGTAMYYALVGLAVYALVVMRRRRVPISPMIAILAMVTLTAAISIGITRYRIGLDVALTILAGVGIDAIWRRLSDRRDAPLGEAAADPEPEPVAP